MKKIIVTTLLASFCLSMSAQEKGLQGIWFVTSQVGFQQSKTGDVKNTNFTILPIVGTFVKPTVAVGGAVGYVSVKAENGSTVNANSGLLVVQPLVRKYWNAAGGLYFFGQMAAPIISGKEKESELKVSQFGLAASGGLDMVLGKHFTVEFSYNLINFSVTTLTPKTGNKTTVTDISLAHVANVEGFYNTALAGSKPTLTTPLAFGFKFLF
ncbi:MAG: outer membrane beta-barrel protein [Chitinophagaceae bacterium]|nr:outer membrane beta-barrel protein [Chitinophagaceae bacterium]